MESMFSYAVSINFRLSRSEVAHLMELSANHYDGHCKSISRPHGFLYGWNNHFIFADTDGSDEISKDFTDVKADFDELDTLCKICEQDHYHQTPNPGLCEKLRVLLKTLSVELNRVNNVK